MVLPTLWAVSPVRVTLLALISTWLGLALGLGAVMQMPPEDASGASTEAAERRLWHTAFVLNGADPCTGAVVTVDAELTIGTVTTGRATRAGVHVDMHLQPRPEVPTRVGIEPLSRQFAPYSTPIYGVPHVHELRTPLQRPHHDLDAVVEVRGSADPHGAVSFTIVGVRLDGRRSPCAGPPAGPPDQPMTRAPSLPTAT